MFNGKKSTFFRYILFIVFLMLVCFSFPFSSLAMDKTLHYQARLMNSSGGNVSDGYYTVTFALYTQGSGGSSFWTETQTLYATGGIVSADLGAVNAFNTDFSSSEYYLGVKVGNDSEMSPRKKLGASPWSVNGSDSQSVQGKTPGTGSNNLLTLNQWGEIDISGRVKTGSGLEVVSGNVILPAGSVNYTELSITSSIQGSDLTSDIDINTTGNISISGTLNATGTFQLNSTAVAATATELNYLSGVTSNVQTQLGAKLGLSGGTMTGNLAMSGNDLLFGDDVSFGYLDPVAPDDFIIAVSGTSNDTLVINNEGSGDIEIITDGSGDIVLESTGGNGVVINNSNLVFTGANDIALQSGADIGLYNGEGVIRFVDSTPNEISIFNANLIMNTNNIVFNNTYGMVSSTGAGSLVFQPGGDNFSMTGSLTLSDSTVNAIIVFDGTGDHGIGFGTAGEPYINFNDGGSGTITVQDSDFVVENNNNYYVCTSQPNCVQVPTAATGRTITVRNNSGGVINQFDAINLVKGSDGLATTIANGEIIYAVYDGTNWVIIGAGH